MSDAIKPPPLPPPERPTTKLSEAEIQKELLNKVLRTMQDGFARQDARADDQDGRLDKIERQVTIAVEDGKDHNKRLTALEVRFDDEVRRANDRSIRVRHESDVNLKQEAAIGTVIANQETHSKDIATLKTMMLQNSAWTKQTLDKAVDAGKGILKKYPKLETAIIACLIAAFMSLAAWIQGGHHP